jgi:dephospho-CoA kinase
VVICEAALLVEAGGLARYDRLLVVTCTLEQKISRFAQRTGVSPKAARDEVQRRMAAQMPEEEKVKLADFVIANSGLKEEVEARVREVWQQMQRFGD